jgi:dipeptidyl aminopeptidase/acylaminoacyl peptidase
MRITIAVLMAAVLPVLACAVPAPKSIEALRAAERVVELVETGKVDGGPGYTAKLYRYQSAGLRVHALVARPLSAPPLGGWPVLIANHGHHPEPPKYGITAEGLNHRPGDYYRRIPELFVARGYLVVMPDFRGHNSSEGFEFTEGLLESAYYTEDVLNLLAGIDSLDDINSERLFMWGHSMGGEVTLRTLLITNRIKAASMWSSVGGDLWEQAYYYSRYTEPMAPDDNNRDKPAVTKLRARISSLDDEFDTRSVEPYRYLDDLETPLIIQHAIDDRGAAYKWSEQLAKELYVRDKVYQFWSVPGDRHLFSDADMEQAADRDAAFFELQSSH